jgi:putative component of membrane protein insertase Oxa1/YidC/SpoIIIJ protein YidD
MLALLLATVIQAAEPWGPWDRPADPVLPAATEEVQTPLQWPIRLYQLTFSRQDLAHCPMFPSCSRFAIQAYEAYDPLQATLMTADRLLRDNPGALLRYRPVAVGGRVLLADPPEDHRLW